MQRSEARVAFPLLGGIDTKSDAKSVQPGKLLQLENGEFTKRGSIRKRPGFDVLSTRVVETIATGELLPPITSGRALGSFHDQLVLFTEPSAYTYHDALNRWSPVKNNPCTPVAARTLPGVFSSREQLFPDVLETAGLTFYSWEEGTALHAAVYTSDGGFVATGNFASTRNSRWVLLSDAVLLFSATGSNLVMRRFPLADPKAGFLASTNVITDLAAVHLYDIKSESSGAAIVAWYNTSNVLRAGRITAAGTFSAVGNVVTLASVVALAIGVTPEIDRMVAVLTTGSLTNAYLADTTSFAQLSMATIADESAGALSAIKLSCSRSGTNKAVVWAERSAASNSNYSVNWAEMDLSALASSYDTQRIRHAHLVDHGFNYNQCAAIWLGFDSTLQSSNFLYTFTGLTSELAGRSLPGSGAGVLSRAHLGGANQISGTNTFVTGAGFRRQLDLDSEQTGNNKNVSFFEHKGFLRLYTDFDHKPRSVDVGQALYVSGAQLGAFDGTSLVESGFHLFPEGVTSANNGAGNLTANAVYVYKVYYEWYNASGERYKSLAIPFTHTVSGTNQTVRLTIPTLTHTRKHGSGSSVAIKVYRSTANQATLCYLVSSNDPSAAGANGWVNNVLTADTITFDDNFADASITAREVDYLSDLPQPLANASPESGEYIIAAQNRVFLAGGTLGENTISFSKLRSDGEPVEFALELQLSIPEDGGPVTALGVLNNTVIVFKRDRIYAVTSTTNGPDNSGDGSYQVEHVTSDTGCTSSDSVVQLPDGLMFLGAKGIYLLDAGFKVGYIGFEVEAHNFQYITAATVISDTNQVVFLVSSEDVASPVYTLMYDYFYKQWSRFTGEFFGVDAVNWRSETYVILKPDGRVFVRENAVFTDGGSPYFLHMQTAPIRLEDSLDGFYKVRRVLALGEYRSPHALQIGMIYNRDLGPYQTVTFQPSTVINTELLGGGVLLGGGDLFGGPLNGSEYLFEFRPKRTKFSTIRFDFTDVVSGESGASYEISEILLDCYVLDSVNKLGANRKV